MRVIFIVPFVASLGLMCVGRPAAAQPPPESLSVKGTVKDRQMGAPVPNARVILRPLPTADIERQAWQNYRTTTDAQGAFQFTQVEEGDYELMVLAPGYRPQRHPRIPMRTSRAEPLDVRLDKPGEPPLFPFRIPQTPLGDLGVDIRELPAELRAEMWRLARLIFGDAQGRLYAPRQFNGVPLEGPPAAPDLRGLGVVPRGSRAEIRMSFLQPNRQPMRPPGAERVVVTCDLPPTPPHPAGRVLVIVTDVRMNTVRLQADDRLQTDARTRVTVSHPGVPQRAQVQLAGDVTVFVLRGSKTIVKIQAPRATILEDAQRIIVDVRSQSS